MIDITSKTFTTQVLEYKGLVLVEFYADWCPPCRRMMQLLGRYGKEQNIKVCKIDIQKNRETGLAYFALGLPSILLFHYGQEKMRTKGLVDLKQTFDPLIRKLDEQGKE